MVERVEIHGSALEGNLERNAVDREALVLLPPSNAEAATRRYPVVHALHGHTIGAEQWSKEIHVPQTADGAFAKGARVELLSPEQREAILVGQSSPHKQSRPGR